MDPKKEEGDCCKTGCGIKCGCCACKAIKALVLLAVGGVIGFFIGKGCMHHKMCMMGSHGMMGAPETMQGAPASPAPAAAPAPAPKKKK